MRILGIETSCDETAVCLVEVEGDVSSASMRVLGNALFSQADKHVAFGGVFPTLAKREHARNILPLLEKAVPLASHANLLSDEQKQKIRGILSREPELAEALIVFAESHEVPDIDLIAVTHGPGLAPALWVGVTFADALRAAWNIPVLPVNHMEGHVVSSLAEKKDDAYVLEDIQFPILALLISGGHTELVSAHDLAHYELLGRTRDDAVGEAYDKVARMLGLPYPGGPQISRLADLARTREKNTEITLPRPMLKSGDLDFSFSGIKTAVLYLVKKLPELTDTLKEDIAREFEDAVTEVLLEKTKKAIHDSHAATFVIGGGVASNTHIRNTLKDSLAKEFPNVSVRLPSLDITTDNALMIALAGFVRAQTGVPALDLPLTATGGLHIEQ